MSLFNISKAYALSPEQIVGPITVPQGVYKINADSGGNIGIILFISNLIKFAIMIGGLFTLINIVLAAFIYLTSAGKSEAHQQVTSKFTMSIIGLLLMIGAYTIAALIGLIFYGDASYILSPTIAPIG